MRRKRRRLLFGILLIFLAGFVYLQLAVAPLVEELAKARVSNRASYIINEAIEAVAMFEAMYAEYAQNPGITRSRMYYEAVSQILPNVKLYINTGSGDSVDMLLPLESLVGGN